MSDSPTNSSPVAPIASALARHTLTGGGVATAAVSHDDIMQLVGVLSTLAGLAWSIYEKVRAARAARERQAVLTAAGLLCILVMSGCASARQTAKVTVTDPKTGLVETREISSRLLATGNSKQALDALKVSAATKSAAIGLSGAEQESQQGELVKAIAAGLADVVRAAVEAAKKP